MKKQSIGKNTVYNMIRTISTVVFPLLVYPYVSRVLGPEKIGIVNFSTSIINYISLIASLGIATYAIRECAMVRDNYYDCSTVASQIFSINVFSTLLAFLVLLCFLIMSANVRAKTNVIALLSVSVIMNTIGCEWIYTAFEDLKFITIRTAVVQIINILSIFLLVKQDADYLVYVGISVSANIVIAITNVLFRRKYCSIKFTTEMEFKKHAKPILLLFALTLSQNIFSSLDITMIGIIRNDYEVGIYSTAVKIYYIVSSLITAISSVTLPQIAQAYNTKNISKIRDLQKYALGYILVIGVPCIIGMYLTAGDIIYLMAGPAFSESAQVLRVLSISLVFVILGGGFLGNIVMLPTNKEKTFMRACVIGTLINVILNYLLIPIYGYLSAAYTTVIGEMVICCYLFCNKSNCYITKFDFWREAKAPVIGGFLFVPSKVVIASLMPNESIARLIITIVICTILYVIVLEIMENPLWVRVMHKRNKELES